MTIKKLYYLLVLCFLHAQANLVASQASYLTEVALNIDKIIPNQKLRERAATHEAGHVTETVAHPSNLRVGYVTIIQDKKMSGHIKPILMPYNSLNEEDIAIGRTRINLAGAAAENVNNNQKPLVHKNDILKYLKDPGYANDMEEVHAIANTFEKYSIEQPMRAIVQTLVGKNIAQILFGKQSDEFIANNYKAAYASQLEQKNNSFKIASELIKNGTLSENDIYQILNTYSYRDTKKNRTRNKTKSGNGYVEKQFHDNSQQMFSKARYKDDNLVYVKYYDDDGLQLPKYVIDKERQILLLKTYTDRKITSTEHKLNGQPIIGSVTRKNYKYGYDNNLNYVGHAGSLDKRGRDRKSNPDELNYNYNNNLQKVSDGTGGFNKYGRDRNGNLAELD